MIFFGMNKIAGLALVTYFVVNSFAANPVFKVDFDVSGRNSNEVTEPNYIPWVVTGVSSKDTTINGVKVTVAKGSAGKALKTTWFKTIVQAPYYSRLTGDGILVEDGNSSGEISLTFSNLEAGTHSLLAYLNSDDSPDAYTYSNIDVYVNGTKKLSNIKPANRPTSIATATNAYVTFSVSKGGSATVTFKPCTSSATFRNVTLNGFAFNVPNSAAQAYSPIPANLDDEANHVNSNLNLTWKAANSAKSHDIYMGTDSISVAKASKSSSEFKGNQAGTSFAYSGASPLITYFWRIDEVDANGIVTQGDVWKFRIGRVAFDGAEGYGRNAVGGRGGKVVYVTNLNDSGAGSLREAVTNDVGPRTIMFKVAGVIKLTSRLVLSSSYVTVAGHSAPGKGITIIGAPFGFTGNNDVIRFMRVRRGYAATTEEQNRGLDGMGITGANHTIVDHSSISWTTDEGFSSRGAKNITLQRTLISEALNIADHPNYSKGTGHGYAATIGGDVGSFHHNLLAHNAGRNWSMGGGLDGNGAYAGRLDIFNNVVYNWYSRVTDGGAHEVNFVGNYYKRGASSKTNMDYVLSADLEGTGTGSQAYYFHNNIMESTTKGKYVADGTDDSKGRRYTLSNGQVLNWDVFVSKPFFESFATIQTAKQAFKDVLSDVGLNRPMDDHDTRIINETKNGTFGYTGSVGKMAGIPDRETDVGGLESYPNISWADNYDSDLDGLPDWWENMYGYNVKSTKGDFSESNKDRLGDGWTELERYLEWLARPNFTFAKSEIQVIDLSQYTKGYDGGTYTLHNIPTGVTATVSGSKMTVKLAEDFGGVGYITFTLKDKEGDSFTRKIGVTQGVAVKIPASSSSSEIGSSSSSNEPAAATIAKCGGGSSKQTVAQGKAITDFCYTWENAQTVKVEGLPAGLIADIDNSAKKVSISGTVTAPGGVYIFTVTSLGNNGESITKSGSITVSTIDGTVPTDTIFTDCPSPFLKKHFHASVINNLVFLSGLPQNAHIAVKDFSGRHLMTQKSVVSPNGTAVVNLDYFGRGIYLVNIRGADFNKTIRIQVK